MSKLFSNITEGAIAGGTIGGALDGLIIGGAAVIAGPVGLVAATEAVMSKKAVGTLIGGAAGVVKTIIEEN